MSYGNPLNTAERLALKRVVAAEAVERAGRVLSAANRKKVEAARDALQAVLDAADVPTAAAGGTVDASGTEKALVLKAEAELRYTLGVMYAPDKLDAHGDFVEDADLHKAVIEYMANSDRRLRLQHDPTVEVGTVVEMVRWPTELKLQPEGQSEAVTLPAGTIYMGVIWDEEPWDKLVKTGLVRGYSLGGEALRVKAPGAAAPAEHVNPEAAPGAS